MKKKKVAIITSFPRAQRVEVYNEMSQLNKIKFRVFYLRKLPYGRYWEDGPTIKHDAVFIPELRVYKHFYFSPGLLKAYIKYDPNLMIMTQYAAFGMQLLMYFESLRKRPWIFWSEAPHVRYAEDPIIRNDYLRKYLRALALLPISYLPKEVWGVGKHAVQKYRRIVRNRIPVKNLPYFADLDRFFLANERRNPATCVRFLFLGSISLRKSADIVAEAVKLLSERGYDFEIHIAGKGPLEIEFKNLPTSAQKHIYWYGFLQLKDIPQIYSRADVLLFPSRYDGWGMTLVEGMASGMPVISTPQVGAAVDMLINGVNGFLLPELTVNNLIAAMRQFIVEPGIIRKMGYRAWKTSKMYTHKVGAHIFLNMIKDALDVYIKR